jgi:hypothetical protein
MTDREVLDRADEQGGRCPICLKDYDDEQPSRKPVVDHTHKPGEKPNNRSNWSERGPSRDVICQGCNIMLSRANDDPQTLRRAADYLETWVTRP